MLERDKLCECVCVFVYVRERGCVHRFERAISQTVCVQLH